MDAVCGETFKTIKLFPNSTYYAVTQCFQYTILSWAPPVFMMLILPGYICSLSSEKATIRRGALNISRMVSAISMALLCVLNIISHIQVLGNHSTTLAILAQAVTTITMILSVLVMEYERRHGVRSSMYFLGLWALYIPVRVATIHYVVLEGGAAKITFEVVAAFNITLLNILNLIVDSVPDNFTQLVEGNPNHVYGSNALRRLTITYGFDIIMLNYKKKALEFEDIWDLLPELSTHSIVHKLENAWANQLAKFKRSRVSVSVETLGHENKTRTGNLTYLPLPTNDVITNGRDCTAKCNIDDGTGKGNINGTDSNRNIDEHKRNMNGETDNPNDKRSKTIDENIKSGGRKHYKMGKVEGPSLMAILVKCHWKLFFLSFAIALACVITDFVKPRILRLLIRFVEDTDRATYYGYVLAVTFFLVSISQTVILSHENKVHRYIWWKLRSSLQSMVYRKALRLSSNARKETTIGEIVNFMSVDVTRYLDVEHFMNVIWVYPTKVAFALYFLWDLLGPSVLAGLGVLLCVVPINVFLVKALKHIQKKQMTLKDERIKLMSEVLNGMKVLKLYAWEPSFELKVLEIRNKELRLIKLGIIVSTVGFFVWTICPFLIAFASFATFVLSDKTNILTAEIVFTSLAYFNILKGPLTDVAEIINGVINLYVSHNRLFHFFMSEELDPDAVRRIEGLETAIMVEHAKFGWEKNKAILKDINLDIPHGCLVAVVGSVGSGKSSLLSALLGEMEKIDGNVTLSGSVAYVPQLAWIQQCSLKDNILFGRSMDQAGYDKVIEYCALQPDLDILPAGDNTEIGEKGINLSGGQKARVSLARAVYNNADVYLLDDPLSAVDSHVGKHIFYNIIGPQGMLRDKTRVLVTHGLGYLSQMDKIICLVDGEITEVGTLDQLLTLRGTFADFYESYQNNQNVPSTPTTTSPLKAVDIIDSFKETKTYLKPQLSHSVSHEEYAQKHHKGDNIRKRFLDSKLKATNSLHDLSKTPSKKHTTRIQPAETSTSTSSQCYVDNMFKSCESLHVEHTESFAENLTYSSGKSNEEDDSKEDDGLLINEEALEKGRIKLTVYSSYLKALGVIPCTLVLVFTSLVTALDITSSTWLAKWTDSLSASSSLNISESNVTDMNGTIMDQNMTLGVYNRPTSTSDVFNFDNNGNVVFFLAVYGALGLSQGISASIEHGAGKLSGLRASYLQHKSLLSGVLNAPMDFFDRTPIGRIINRFSSDVSILDTDIPDILAQILRLMFRIAGSMVVTCMMTPYFLVPLAIVAVLYAGIQSLYIGVRRQNTRLGSVYRSPIYAHFNETLVGVRTIRAYNLQDSFTKDSDNKIDRLVKVNYNSFLIERWLGFCLGMIGDSFVLLAGLFAVANREHISGGTVGLVITYAMMMTSQLSRFVFLLGIIDVYMISVERVRQYAGVQSEAPKAIPEKKPASDWPQNGEIKFKNFSVRYRAGQEMVLRCMDANIRKGEKVGIVGRTGAGKSSLALSLFRIIEGAGGNITIDGVDISTIGLHDLRSKLTIIPQDPVLFSGSLRINLDPFSVNTEIELWKALEHAFLKDFVSGLPGGLQHECAEGGDNLSVGQRQLVCLARALLRKSKILILDEATAACDMETDELIQSTIRTEFRHCTVLTIAHRLNTIMDYDKVLVLDKGRTVEFDSPDNLMKGKKSMFYYMVVSSGNEPNEHSQIRSTKHDSKEHRPT